jgi:hypothetical protein
MVPHILIVLAGLALLGIPTSAANLRKDTPALVKDQAAEIPVERENTAFVYKGLVQNTAILNDRERRYAEDSIAAAHANARKRVADLHKTGKLAEMKSKASVMTATTDLLIRNGAFVTRRRPNGDCSGEVSRITASLITEECHPDGFGGSYYLSCSHENDQGNVMMRSILFAEEGCTNGWYGDLIVHEDPRCQYNRYGEPMDTPSMLGSQCAKDDMTVATQGGGIANIFFAEGDSTCTGPPDFVSVEKYDVCRLGYNGSSEDPTGFFYYTLDACAAATGRADVTYYTDSACLRPVGRDSFTIGGVNNGPHSTCQFDGQSAYGMTMCIPKGGV